MYIMRILLKYIREILNINIFKRQKHVDLQFEADAFEFEDMDGKPLFEDMQHQGRWRIKVKQAKSNPYIYFLILKESDKRVSLEKELESFPLIFAEQPGRRSAQLPQYTL